MLVSFLKYSFLFYILSVSHMCSGYFGGQKRALDLLELEVQIVVSCLMCVWRTKVGPLEEQEMPLMVKPFLHPQHMLFYFLEQIAFPISVSLLTFLS